jgi:peroxiredoxin
VIRPTVLLLLPAALIFSQQQDVVFTKQEAPLAARIRAISQLAPENRGPLLAEVALQVRRLPASLNKLRFADTLAFLATAGDSGSEALQEVGTTLAAALREQPGKLDSAYLNLAQLVHYEHVRASLDDPRFAAAVSRLEEDDRRRARVDFTLTDLGGKSWTLKNLRGNVVLVIFWASWSRPSQQEMADCEFFYQLFKKQGLVVLAISTEKAPPVESFVNLQKITFPVLLDPDQKIVQQYKISGVPKIFVYDRKGNLAAQALDFRTHQQVANMLKQAGLE